MKIIQKTTHLYSLLLHGSYISYVSVSPKWVINTRENNELAKHLRMLDNICKSNLQVHKLKRVNELLKKLILIHIGNKKLVQQNKM